MSNLKEYNKDYLYAVIEWPESQEYMDYEGFKDNCFLADCDMFGGSAYACKLSWLESLEDTTANERTIDIGNVEED